MEELRGRELTQDIPKPCHITSAVVLNRRHFAPLPWRIFDNVGDVFNSHDWEYYWHLVGRVHGRCSISCRMQHHTPQQRALRFKLSIALLWGNPELVIGHWTSQWPSGNPGLLICVKIIVMQQNLSWKVGEDIVRHNPSKALHPITGRLIGLEVSFSLICINNSVCVFHLTTHEDRKRKRPQKESLISSCNSTTK